MNYEQFKKNITEEIKQLTGRQNEVRVIKVEKNNSVQLDGLIIIGGSEKASPAIYLEDFFKSYQEGMDIKQIAREIQSFYEDFKCCRQFNGDDFADYDKVKESIRLKVVNYEKNQELLKAIPHIPFLDLAVVFYCMLEREAMQSSTVLVYHKHLEMWGVSQEEIAAQARSNTWEYLGWEFKSMYEVIGQLSEGGAVPEDINQSKKSPLYVLTNRARIFGAACIYFSEVLSEVREQLKEDFYILPSSIHEVIIVPVSAVKGKDCLEEMVREVNGTQVEEVDILSDRVYHYCDESNHLS